MMLKTVRSLSPTVERFIRRHSAPVRMALPILQNFCHVGAAVPLHNDRSGKSPVVRNDLIKDSCQDLINPLFVSALPRSAPLYHTRLSASLLLAVP